MSETTGIEWCDHTHNTWWGCVKVSPACKRCYAEAWAKRVGLAVWGDCAPRRFFGDDHWSKPEIWNRRAAKAGVRRKVFCASMADVFEQLPDNHPQREAMQQARERLWKLIESTPWLDWLLLTKRPGNVKRMVPASWLASVFPVNAWVGTTVENQEEADRRLPLLVDIPARVLFVSAEPLLEKIQITRWLGRIHWVIAGGESGHGARPMDPTWALSLRDQCSLMGVPFFFKQWGGHPDKRGGAAAILDGRRHVEFPRVSVGVTERPTTQSLLPLV